MRRGRERLAPLALAAPGVLLLLGLMILPALSVVPASMTDWEFGRGEFRFVGLQNYQELAADPVFTAALVNTVLYVLTVVPVTVALGMLLALLIDGGGRLKGFYQAVHFLPVVATMAAMAIAWDTLLHPTFGLLNQALGAFGLEGRNWLRDPGLVMPTLAAIGVWNNLGFAIVLFLAGLKTVPQELIDAATIDGATSLPDRARVVMLPLLAPVALFVTIITAKRALAVFDTVQVMTQGGPGHASEVLVHLLYMESFERLRAGYGASITVVYIALLMTLIAFQRVADRRIHYR